MKKHHGGDGHFFHVSLPISLPDRLSACLSSGRGLLMLSGDSGDMDMVNAKQLQR